MPEVARGNGTDSVDTNHGCDATTVTDQCSPNVFVNGIGVVRKDDLTKSHLVPGGDDCVSHAVPLTTYSSTVFVNGKNLGRKGDAYSGHTITSGSENVFAGG